jgi:peptidoglycan hydrolase CwlO-like protein
VRKTFSALTMAALITIPTAVPAFADNGARQSNAGYQPLIGWLGDFLAGWFGGKDKPSKDRRAEVAGINVRVAVFDAKIQVLTAKIERTEERLAEKMKARQRQQLEAEIQELQGELQETEMERQLYLEGVCGDPELALLVSHCGW